MTDREHPSQGINLAIGRFIAELSAVDPRCTRFHGQKMTQASLKDITDAVDAVLRAMVDARWEPAPSNAAAANTGFALGASGETVRTEAGKNRPSARCEEGDLAFVKNGENDGMIVRVDGRESNGPSGQPVWRVTTMGSPLPVKNPDGGIVRMATGTIADEWLVPMRMTLDTPTTPPARRRRKPSTNGH